MLNGFKKFVMRGNVIDLAVAVVMGGAFGAVVTALVKDLLTPIIAAVVGKPDFSGIVFTINGSKFPIGDFINAAVGFLLIALAIGCGDTSDETNAADDDGPAATAAVRFR